MKNATKQFAYIEPNATERFTAHELITDTFDGLGIDIDTFRAENPITRQRTIRHLSRVLPAFRNSFTNFIHESGLPDTDAAHVFAGLAALLLQTTRDTGVPVGSDIENPDYFQLLASIIDYDTEHPADPIPEPGTNSPALKYHPPGAYVGITTNGATVRHTTTDGQTKYQIIGAILRRVSGTDALDYIYSENDDRIL